MADAAAGGCHPGHPDLQYVRPGAAQRVERRLLRRGREARHCLFHAAADRLSRHHRGAARPRGGADLAAGAPQDPPAPAPDPGAARSLAQAEPGLPARLHGRERRPARPADAGGLPPLLRALDGARGRHAPGLPAAHQLHRRPLGPVRAGQLYAQRPRDHGPRLHGLGRSGLCGHRLGAHLARGAPADPPQHHPLCARGRASLRAGAGQ